LASTFAVDLAFSAKTRELDAAVSKLKGMDAVAAKLQGQLDQAGAALKKQGTSNAQLATQLRKLKGEYESLSQAAKKSAATGGAGFDAATVSKLRGLSTEINRTREAFLSGKAAAAQYRQELDQVAQAASKAGAPGARLRNTVGQFGRGAGAGAAAAGAFSGVPGLSAVSSGAAAGGLATGGAAGAVAGGVAAGVLALGAAAISTGKDIAIWYGQLNQSQVALEGVSNSTEDFKASLDGLDRISARLNVPIGEATQQFTALRASMSASGFAGADTLKVFENLAVANAALGGNAEKLQGILLATTQIFSKGKVSAEELRGQIGERLPGAFALFAQATGRTTQQLDEDLQNGEVSLADFVKFTELAGKRFGDAADKMAKSGNSAGDRLKKAWEDFSRVLGPILSAAGAAIQDFATKSLQAITPLLDGLARFFQLNRQGKNDRLYEVNQTISRNQKLMNELLGRNDQAAKDRLQVLRRQTLELKKEGDELNKALNPKIQKPADVAPPSPLDPSKDKDKDKDKKGSIDTLYDYANQNAAQLAQNEIELNRQVFNDEMALLRQRFETEQSYLEKLAGLRGAGLTPGGRDTFGAISQFNSAQQGYANKLRELTDAVANAQQDLNAAKAGIGIERLRGSNPAVGTVASGGGSSAGRYIQGGYGPSGPNAYGPHFDIKRQDGSYFGRSALDQFVTVNGKPLSSGLTVPGGQFGASRDGGARTHNAWDYAFGGRAELQLQNGAKWMGSSSTSYGDNAVFQTPDGKIYRIIHGTFSGGSGGGVGEKQITAGGQADLTGALGAQGDVSVAEAALDGANQRLKEYTAWLEKVKALDFPTLLATMAQGFTDQTTALQNQTAQLQLRTRLELEGVDSAIVDGELQKLQISQQLKQNIEGLDAALKLYIETQGKAGISAQQHADALKNLQAGAAGAAAAVTNNAAAQQAANQAQQAKSDAQGISSTFTSGIKEAIKAAVTGGDVKAALSNMLSGIGDRLLDMAFRPLEQLLTQQLTQMFNPQTLATNANSTATVANTAAVSYLSGVIQAQAFTGGASVGGFDWGGIASSVLGAFSGGFGVAGAGFGGGAFGAGFNPLSTTKLFSGGIFEGGGYTGNAPRAGGMDGKGGFPAILHPGETVTDHRSSAARSALNGGGSGGGAPSMTLNVTATQIADDRWVKVDDLDAAMSKAARQGAAMGERRTLDRLRQSPNTRRQLGI
jgi:tape measure domain-containing protein